MTDLRVHLCGVPLKNPVIAASGTFGFGREYDKYYDISRLGGVSVKGLTLKPRAGNPPHRIAETPSGMLNAVGLQNPGVDAFLRDELPWLKAKGVTVFANIAGSIADEYCAMADKLSSSDVDFIEMNISCPNVKEGGVAFGAMPDSVYAITRAVKSVAKQPLIVKLTPNTADIAQTAIAAEAAGADAVSLINTITGMMIDVNARKPILANITGGLSGPAIKPVALRMVYQASRAVSIPVIGMGGIASGEDAAAFMLAGATAFMVGTANIANPYACINILDQLTEYLSRQKIESAGELTGGLIT